DNGKLTCGLPGQQIENYIVERIEAYNKKQANIFFLMDLHYEENSYHPENNLFPPHNIIDTTGRELYGKVNDIFQNILDRKSTRLNSSHVSISYAVFCLKTNKQ